MADTPQENNTEKTRQEDRAERLRKKRSKMKQHGKGLTKMYRDAVEKRQKNRS
jgi:hypothetical protein